MMLEEIRETISDSLKSLEEFEIYCGCKLERTRKYLEEALDEINKGRIVPAENKALEALRVIKEDIESC